MTTHAWILLACYAVVLLLLAVPLGRAIAHVMEGRSALAGRIEGALYRLCGIDPDTEMGWLQYTLAILLFNGLGLLAVYGLQRLQLWLPLNPQGLPNVSPDSAFDTAISFATNTNWQGYGGETTMSYLTQMLGLGVQNFLSAATGIVVVIALIRGFARHGAKGVLASDEAEDREHQVDELDADERHDLLTAITGVAYPLLVTGVAGLVFPSQAAGSLLLKDGKPVGSSLIGQSFTEPRYFWSRPSATGPMPYNAGSSSGSNQGPLNPALTDAVKGRVEALRAADPGNSAPVPVDLVTASASGLDPHITLAAAQYQASRVARVRGVSPDVIDSLIARHTDGRLFGVLGETRVNVLELNLDLDRSSRR